MINTGGSNEIILTNKGKETVGSLNEKVSIRQIIVRDPIHQGSYNYSETSKVGLAAHELRDVQPHVAEWGFYVNPLDPFSPLGTRYFPALDMDGKTLADQEN